MSRLVELMKQVAALPEAQRQVLIPVFATALQEVAPEGSSLSPELTQIVQEFWAKVERPTPEETSSALSALMRAAGISEQVFRDLSLSAGLAGMAEASLGALAPGAKFQPRAAPQAGQHRGGIAQIALMQKK